MILSNISVITDVNAIAELAKQKEEENEHFLQFIQRQEEKRLDELVHDLNDEVTSAIDCTQCGNCCKTLMINITAKEVDELANFLQQPVQTVKTQYIEESLAGNCIINTIPCSFLNGKMCSIYAGRFTECRDFPHLQKDGFKERLQGTLLHYGSCPIIYNVVEGVKSKTGFLS